MKIIAIKAILILSIVSSLSFSFVLKKVYDDMEEDTILSLRTPIALVTGGQSMALNVISNILNEHYYTYFSFTIKGVCTDYSEKVIFKFIDGKIYNTYTDNGFTCDIDGSQALTSLNESQIGMLCTRKLQKIRVYVYKGYTEHSIPVEKAMVIQKAFQEIKNIIDYKDSLYRVQRAYRDSIDNAIRDSVSKVRDSVRNANAIIIRTNPIKASIDIIGVEEIGDFIRYSHIYQGKSPIRITNVWFADSGIHTYLPNKFIIRAKKEGYIDMEDTVTCYAGGLSLSYTMVPIK